METKQKLSAKLLAKKLEIQTLVAEKYGLGNLSELSPAVYKHIEMLTDERLADWEAAYRNYCPRTQDDKGFNSLAREYYETKKLLNEE